MLGVETLQYCIQMKLTYKLKVAFESVNECV